MADEIDQAQERMESVAEAQRRLGVVGLIPAPQLLPKSECHYCELPVAGDKLFCDRRCADDWETERRQLKSLGRA